ncbi:hypothetical protein Cadr_000003163 [Camelus dromedarius]|uniref:Uncharacterized protein n=1 Tax=Camelus dromedarius TaxID=9838 RepID=A0A5N4C333_CAMDR|nr:hypothetical protein Cadr_000003163 [Camelus dromedarius]
MPSARGNPDLVLDAYFWEVGSRPGREAAGQPVRGCEPSPAGLDHLTCRWHIEWAPRPSFPRTCRTNAPGFTMACYPWVSHLGGQCPPAPQAKGVKGAVSQQKALFGWERALVRAKSHGSSSSQRVQRFQEDGQPWPCTLLKPLQPLDARLIIQDKEEVSLSAKCPKCPGFISVPLSARVCSAGQTGRWRPGCWPTGISLGLLRDENAAPGLSLPLHLLPSMFPTASGLGIRTSEHLMIEARLLELQTQVLGLSRSRHTHGYAQHQSSCVRCPIATTLVSGNRTDPSGFPGSVPSTAQHYPLGSRMNPQECTASPGGAVETAHLGWVLAPPRFPWNTNSSSPPARRDNQHPFASSTLATETLAEPALEPAACGGCDSSSKCGVKARGGFVYATFPGTVPMGTCEAETARGAQHGPDIISFPHSTLRTPLPDALTALCAHHTLAPHWGSSLRWASQCALCRGHCISSKGSVGRMTKCIVLHLGLSPALYHPPKFPAHHPPKRPGSGTTLAKSRDRPEQDHLGHPDDSVGWPGQGTNRLQPEAPWRDVLPPLTCWPSREQCSPSTKDIKKSPGQAWHRGGAVAVLSALGSLHLLLWFCPTHSREKKEKNGGVGGVHVDDTGHSMHTQCTPLLSPRAWVQPSQCRRLSRFLAGGSVAPHCWVSLAWSSGGSLVQGQFRVQSADGLGLTSPNLPGDLTKLSRGSGPGPLAFKTTISWGLLQPLLEPWPGEPKCGLRTHSCVRPLICADIDSRGPKVSQWGLLEGDLWALAIKELGRETTEISDTTGDHGVQGKRSRRDARMKRTSATTTQEDDGGTHEEEDCRLTVHPISPALCRPREISPLSSAGRVVQTPQASPGVLPEQDVVEGEVTEDRGSVSLTDTQMIHSKDYSVSPRPSQNSIEGGHETKAPASPTLSHSRDFFRGVAQNLAIPSSELPGVWRGEELGNTQPGFLPSLGTQRIIMWLLLTTPERSPLASNPFVQGTQWLGAPHLNITALLQLANCPTTLGLGGDQSPDPSVGPRGAANRRALVGGGRTNKEAQQGVKPRSDSRVVLGCLNAASEGHLLSLRDHGCERDRDPGDQLTPEGGRPGRDMSSPDKVSVSEAGFGQGRRAGRQPGATRPGAQPQEPRIGQGRGQGRLRRPPRASSRAGVGAEAGGAGALGRERPTRLLRRIIIKSRQGGRPDRHDESDGRHPAAAEPTGRDWESATKPPERSPVGRAKGTPAVEATDAQTVEKAQPAWPALSRLDRHEEQDEGGLRSAAKSVMKGGGVCLQTPSRQIESVSSSELDSRIRWRGPPPQPDTRLSKVRGRSSCPPLPGAHLGCGSGGDAGEQWKMSSLRKAKRARPISGGVCLMGSSLTPKALVAEGGVPEKKIPPGDLKTWPWGDLPSLGQRKVSASSTGTGHLPPNLWYSAVGRSKRGLPGPFGNKTVTAQRQLARNPWQEGKGVRTCWWQERTRTQLETHRPCSSFSPFPHPHRPPPQSSYLCSFCPSSGVGIGSPGGHWGIGLDTTLRFPCGLWGSRFPHIGGIRLPLPRNEAGMEGLFSTPRCPGLNLSCWPGADWRRKVLMRTSLSHSTPVPCLTPARKRGDLFSGGIVGAFQARWYLNTRASTGFRTLIETWQREPGRDHAQRPAHPEGWRGEETKPHCCLCGAQPAPTGNFSPRRGVSEVQWCLGANPSGGVSGVGCECGQCPPPILSART